jgi:hypothetical protein
MQKKYIKRNKIQNNNKNNSNNNNNMCNDNNNNNNNNNSNNNKLPNIMRFVGMNKRPSVLIRSRPGFHGSRVSTGTILTEMTDGWIRG